MAIAAPDIAGDFRRFESRLEPPSLDIVSCVALELLVLLNQVRSVASASELTPTRRRAPVVVAIPISVETQFPLRGALLFMTSLTRVDAMDPKRERS
jgi:CRISPR/Cas system-associated exonuclease Cas4 (RecB family)